MHGIIHWLKNPDFPNGCMPMRHSDEVNAVVVFVRSTLKWALFAEILLKLSSFALRATDSGSFCFCFLAVRVDKFIFQRLIKFVFAVQKNSDVFPTNHVNFSILGRAPK